MTSYDKILECYILFVDYKMSYREVAKNLCLKSHNTVRKRLELLKDINDEMYQAYKAEAKRRAKR